jgi:hypothetical protein
LFVIIILLFLRLAGTSLSDVYCEVAKGLNASATCGKPQTYCNDSFDNLSNWSSASDWKLNNGQLCNNLNSANFIFNSCSQAVNFPQDYTVNVDVATLYSGDGYGVTFRQTSTNPAERILSGKANVQGRVVDEHGLPVSARVIIFGSELSATTNPDGMFILNGVPAGSQMLVVAYNISAIEIPITVMPGQDMDIGQVQVKVTAAP